MDLKSGYMYGGTIAAYLWHSWRKMLNQRMPKYLFLVKLYKMSRKIVIFAMCLNYDDAERRFGGLSGPMPENTKVSNNAQFNYISLCSPLLHYGQACRSKLQYGVQILLLP